MALIDVRPRNGRHYVLRKTWDRWSAGTPLYIIEYVDKKTKALCRIGRTGHTEQVTIPLDYIIERKRG
jgi:hypothetical protein